ncbi:hypothetical protein G7011_00480 [Pseudomonas plecoglossicida]|uniref:hypothetical protein n=1 Tax=Pseudomonas plecoglossicida TaxID=70775 RepID=UPI0015E43065|nr:hypothetical protein [Pseudomonas plecoglossicida]MBA1195589.1 hypothetical protein [Pseudomonas plecoglossicida]
MPTDNRSSNTEMVSVPREPTREMLAAAREVNGIFPTWRAMVAAAPADQRQHEYPPCDYCGTVPDYHPWHGSRMINGTESKHIHACDGCRSKLPPHTEARQTEPGAWYDPQHQDFLTAEGRAATLRMGDGDRLARYSVRLFAAPTAAEELDSVRHWRGNHADVMRERDTLRAQLTQQEELLGAIGGWTSETRAAVLEAFQDELNESASYAWYDAAIADLMALVGALSASAEPSAPTWSCQPCQLEQPTDRPCDACSGHTELSAAKS